jgi:hypothetical protein
MHSLRLLRGLSLALLALAGAGSSFAQTTGQAAATRFTQTLTPQEQTAVGIAKLTEDQLASLDAQIGRELRLARQGDAIAFVGTFSSRRPSSEYTAAGLATLTPSEIAALDEYVARAIAQRPVTVPPRTDLGNRAIETETRRAQWHGEITMMYGRGSGGREFYGGSVTTIYDDPDHNFAAAITVGQYRGDGYYFGPGYYGYGPPYGYGRGGYGLGRCR